MLVSPDQPLQRLLRHPTLPPMDDALHQPHDKLFVAAFGVPENTAALLKATIPGAIASKLEWEKMRSLPGSFVDTHYERSHTDLLFSVPFAGREVLLYVARRSPERPRACSSFGR